ncbi:MAG: hypothetical protein RLY31_1237 [Bacteroidota bacterium]|jgi:PAS domain S-box-containing protein
MPSANHPIPATQPGDKIPRGFESLRLKTKIRLVLLALLSSITLIGVLGGYYIQRTSKSTILMLRENYVTINYTREMSKAVNDMIWALTLEKASPAWRRQQLRTASETFETYLGLQLNKASEQEEQELTQQLKTDYEDFKQQLRRLQASSEVPTDVYMKQLNIQGILQLVHDLNDRMIRERTDDAGRTADKVTFSMLMIGLVFLLFSLLALHYFPRYIAQPIQLLTASIRQVARKDYNQRVDIRRGDEFGELARSFNWMAQKLAEYDNINLANIISEKRRTETIVRRMNDAIIGLDDQRNILFANPPALALTGLQDTDLIGRPAAELTLHNQPLQTILQEVLTTDVHGSQAFQSIRIEKDGRPLYFNKDILRIEAQPGEEAGAPATMGFIIILKNVTELKEQDLAKTNFLATLSHELKTPIAAMDMSVNLLEDARLGTLNEEQRQLTRTIRQNIGRILKMVNEILDISRIETGKLQLETERFPPAEVVARALESIGTFLPEKQLTVRQHIDQDLPLLSMDVHKTGAVLVNFLTNAIRHSPPEGHIDVRVARQAQSVCFSVRDEGPGIPAEDQRKLFQPYRRTAGDKTIGTGLGLAISKEFVEAQGGRIWVDSSPGEGSLFCFALPVA